MNVLPPEGSMDDDQVGRLKENVLYTVLSLMLVLTTARGIPAIFYSVAYAGKALTLLILGSRMLFWARALRL